MTTRRRGCPQCGALFPNYAQFCGVDGSPTLAAGEDPLVGRSIDRYEIEAVLGDGGMARVYRARHRFLERECAVKVLYGEMAAQSELTLRFRREALTAGKIKHPNVVDVTDFGLSEHGLPFMAMELVDGVPLARLMRDAPRRSIEWMADLTRQLAAGLGAAHDLGFVHRDVKPGNVMVVGDGPRHHVKILDFGLVHTPEHPEDLDSEGKIVGTPTYMSPEQIRGEEVDGRSDLYSLGVILHRMIAGCAPFIGDVNEVLARHITQAPPELPATGGLEILAGRLMEKDPSRRPQSASEVCDILEAFLGPASLLDINAGFLPPEPMVSIDPSTL